MSLPNTQQRKQVFDKRDQGEQFRDIQQAIDTVPRMITRRMDAYYKEPMALGSPLPNQQPESIELVRIVNLNAQETPVGCGQMVHWKWQPQQGGAVVTSIDGLSPSATIPYRFWFRFTYTAPAGLG